jgi:crotonobetainyl-CoA:carnitine CoA-transferase CaiB-like acyl-CoA transferase
VLGNLALDYEAMRSIRPDVILCSLSAYGHDGPWANTPGIGGTIEPTSGMSALVGYSGGPPMNSGQMYPDAVAGLNAATAILAAIHHRNVTGRGQYIDLSMQEANLSFIGEAALEYQLTGAQPPRLGNRHHTFAPHGIYPCAGDGQWVALACETEQQWRKFCVLLDESWIHDPRFATPADRKANEDALDALISAETRRIKRDILVIMFQGVGVVAAPVHDGREVAADAALRARGMVTDVEHREAGPWPQAVSPFHFTRTRPDEVRPAPLLGEHTFEVMQELLGSTREEYEALVAAGVSGKEPRT